MSCLECKNASPDVLSFKVLEVHTLHIRDFSGERIIQALGGFQDYEICTACASKEVQTVLLPTKRIITKCLPFFMLVILGMILSLTLTFRDVITALKALGPIALAAGVSGIFGKVNEILNGRRKLITMNPEEALKYSAYQLGIKNAPKKYGDNDLTYIPVNEETLNLSAEELSSKFNLLRSIAAQAYAKLEAHRKIFTHTQRKD